MEDRKDLTCCKGECTIRFTQRAYIGARLLASKIGNAPGELFGIAELNRFLSRATNALKLGIRARRPIPSVGRRGASL